MISAILAVFLIDILFTAMSPNYLNICNSAICNSAALSISCDLQANHKRSIPCEGYNNIQYPDHYS